MKNAKKDQTATDSLGSHPVKTLEVGFESLGLSAEILKSIRRVGFTHPTKIQSAVIPSALAGNDIIGLAQTGSGKTAAFVIPLAARLTHKDGPRGLVICPTREIALQTREFLVLFGAPHDLKTACVIGGVKMLPQLRELKDKPDIIVATPGRLVDHLERKNVSLDKIEELVIDEADHMLDMGFLPQLKQILKYLPKKKRTMMFSATMPAPIERLANQYLVEPVRIDVLPDGKAAEGIDHRLYLVEDSEKKKCLLALLNQELGSTLVFTRRKIDADWLCGVLEKEGHPVTSMHSDRSQSERTQALKGFRAGKHRILVATDIVSRGVDVAGIEHIVNFDIPQTVDEYIHRAGRTARMNAKGTVSTIATWADKEMVAKIEDVIRMKLPRCTIAGVKPLAQLASPKPLRARRQARW